MSVHEQSPVRVAPNVTVTDAFVDYESTHGELYVTIDGPLDHDTALPVAADESGERWLAESDSGLIWSFHDGPVHPPADAASRTDTVSVTRADGRTDDRVIDYTHVTTSIQNERSSASALSVNYKAPDGFWRQVTTRVGLARDIISAYINGDQGTANVDHWYHHKQTTWGLEPDEPSTARIELVRDPIRTWVPVKQ